MNRSGAAPRVEEAGRPRRPARRSWLLRLVGCLFGLSVWVIGVYSLLGAGADLPEVERDSALGFGIVALVVGGVAIAGSLGARDVHRLWYCSPHRWRLFREGR